MHVFTFEINGNHLGIPIEDIAFIEGHWNTITGETGTPSYIKEIIMLHGTTVSIYNLESLFGYPEQKMEYVVALNSNGAALGLAISGASEIITVDENAIHPVPPMINATRHFVKSMVCHHGKMISLIDAGSLIPPDMGCPGGTENGI